MKKIIEVLKKYKKDIFSVSFFIIVVGIFFYKTILFGQLPIPSDTLVGMYHPWRDAYAHSFTNGVPFKNFLITDPIRQQIPWRKQVVDALKNKKLPLWDAMSFSGTPLLGNIQSGALYPLNFLFFLFPFAVSWSILIISQPLLGGLFLYFFLRHKQLDFLSALFGSIVFAFSGFSIAWMTWGTICSTLLWVPLILLSLGKIHEMSKNIWIWRGIFLFAVVSSFFAGHIQMFVYGMIMTFLYEVYVFRKIRKISFKPFHGSMFLVLVLFLLPMVLRMMSWYPQTVRIGGADYMVEGFFIPIQHLLQFIAPDFFGNPATLNYWGVWNYGEMIGYVGLSGLLFAFIGIGSQTVFWIVAIALSLLFSVQTPVSQLPFIYHIPIASLFQPTRLMAIIDLSLSILAAYGFSSLIHYEKKKRTVGVICLFGCIMGIVWASTVWPEFFGIPKEFLEVSKRNLILPGILFGATFLLTFAVFFSRYVHKVLRYSVIIGILIVISFDLIRFGWKFTPFTKETYFFPKTEIILFLEQQPKPFRVMATDDRLVPPNTLSFYGIESISGYDPVHSKRYETYIAAMERGEPNIKPPYGFGRIISPKTITSPLLPLLNVKFILSIDGIDNKNVKLLSEEGTTKLYKLTNSAPRAYIADRVFVRKSDDEIFNTLYDSIFIPGSSAILEEDVSITSTEPLLDTESANILYYSNDKLTIQTETHTSRLLVVGNMMDSHWEAKVDGAKTKIYRTNYLFMGVIIPIGQHVVTIQYR